MNNTNTTDDQQSELHKVTLSYEVIDDTTPERRNKKQRQPTK